MSVTVPDVLLFLQLGLLFAALPLSVIAAYGFRGTPWGRVVRLLPAMEVFFVVATGLLLADIDGSLLVVQTIAYVMAVATIAVLAIRLTRIVTGGVRT